MHRNKETRTQTLQIRYPFILSVLLALLIGIILPWSINALGCNEQEMQANFNLEYMSGPVAADRAPHDFIRIFVSEAGTEENPRWKIEKGRQDRIISKENGLPKELVEVDLSRELSAEELAGLFDTLNENCFWTMSKVYRDPDILDGDYKRIRVINGETDHQVTCVNKRKDPFETVGKYILSLVE